MVQQRVMVKLKTGLQARPAAFFVQEANRYRSEIYVEKDNKKVNAKSIMGIMSLAISSGTEITILASGDDAQMAVDTLAGLINKDE
ncbi:HPr family phosphocarrier protein [Brevibacillus sp. 7WMA2]|uniref:Phosphotransferase system HPr family protein n=3 Tax=Brevibacillus TaxID=55080 RepID=A0A075RBI6_BRELA|nr:MULTISPECIES: HPr family phosphocarrier protein [Brevibacillus]HAS00407.1 HPr family phosphocarrier protein [Brevibacillus sp.]AIG28588.1 phosphotransferase system HPr family protein [Brevibacillus laterosporus LMG 15441]AKF93018.1 phosphocarrier protein Chr [Brevibacillus laterosporus]AUM66926.1 HPr family phosphocarrier protein [Brevibacillus laterosporus]AYK05784.1 HPr family phosphocarrier protein [Brevibacillus laterosporus]